MRLQSWFSCLGIGTLVLSGMLVTGSSSSAQDATPAAQTAADTADEDNGKPVVGTPLLEPAIDLVRAQEIALEGHTGAAVMDVELGGENGVLAYSVTLDSGMEVDIDATSGEVIRTEEQEGEQDEDQDEDDDEGQNQKDNGDEDEDDRDDDD
jgi:Peptidase propeptide and YPEB domain